MTYPVVADILDRVLGGGTARLRGRVNVPELHPPVEQKGIVGDLVGGQRRQGQVVYLLNRVGAVHLVVGTGLFRGHLHVALEHGARQADVLVPQEVVVNVRVELLGGVSALAARLRHIAHDRGAVDGAVVRIHGRHLRHLLLVLHRGDAWGSGCVGRTSRGGGLAMGVRGGGRGSRRDVVSRAPRCWSERLHQHGTSSPRGIGAGAGSGVPGPCGAGAVTVSCGRASRGPGGIEGCRGRVATLVSRWKRRRLMHGMGRGLA